MEDIKENKKDNSKGLNLTIKSYLSSILVILGLMIVTYILTFIIPSGTYTRIVNDAGQTVVDTSVPYKSTDGNLPLWKFLLSPFLVLTSDGSSTIIAVILFLIIIGGVITTLYKCNLMEYMVGRIVHKFGSKRYVLLSVLTLVFMSMGAFVGSFEEVVPLTPIVVALCISLGFDALTGIAVSLMATGCGFASGVINPFTVGVAQKLAGVPMFSGIWLRLLSYVLIYGLLLGFIMFHAKRVEKPIDKSETTDFKIDKEYDKALIAFMGSLLVGVLVILSSTFITALQDYTTIVVCLMFLVAGISSCAILKFSFKDYIKTFLNGVVQMLPAVLMILMASSVKYILTESETLDTILYYSSGLAQKIPKSLVILLIYMIALVINFFVPSGSAEAFLLIPILVPIASNFGISAQLTIVAYAFGDGFSNVFYPTNTALLLSLNVSGIQYSKYAKWSIWFQLLNLVLTSLILLFGLAVGY